LKIENYQLADIIFPYLHISIFPSPEGRSCKQIKLSPAVSISPLLRGVRRGLKSLPSRGESEGSLIFKKIIL